MKNNVSQKKLFSSLGQGHEFELAMIKQGVTPVQVQDVIDGKLKISFSSISISAEYIVDCDAMPEILSDWQKEEHRQMGKMKLENRGGKLYANGRKIIRFLSKKQKNGKVIGGCELRQELASKLVLNARVLDYLLKHPELIPEEWKTGLTYFWGTIFRSSGGGLCVAYLRWNGGGWRWGYGWLDDDWSDGGPAACLASS